VPLARAAIRTLRAIERQTGELQESVSVARTNAAAAKASAEAATKNIEMLISKERARIRIEEVEAKFVTMAVRFGTFPRESDRIEFRITCHGSTPAFILDSYTDAWVSESVEAPSTNAVFMPMSLPKVISQNTVEIDQWIPIDAQMDGRIDQSAAPKD
jgi:hypothetical protein